MVHGNYVDLLSAVGLYLEVVKGLSLKDFLEQLHQGFNDSTLKAASDSFKSRQKVLLVLFLFLISIRQK